MSKFKTLPVKKFVKDYINKHPEYKEQESFLCKFLGLYVTEVKEYNEILDEVNKFPDMWNDSSPMNHY